MEHTKTRRYAFRFLLIPVAILVEQVNSELSASNGGEYDVVDQPLHVIINN